MLVVYGFAYLVNGLESRKISPSSQQKAIAAVKSLQAAVDGVESVFEGNDPENIPSNILQDILSIANASIKNGDLDLQSILSQDANLPLSFTEALTGSVDVLKGTGTRIEVVFFGLRSQSVPKEKFLEIIGVILGVVGVVTRVISTVCSFVDCQVQKKRNGNTS
uniref:Uncharacterized protein n=1 Tax=Acrobeloides nanus TaxID=290746 RepID=A0A914D3N4_9BILA